MAAHSGDCDKAARSAAAAAATEKSDSSGPTTRGGRGSDRDYKFPEAWSSAHVCRNIGASSRGFGSEESYAKAATGGAAAGGGGRRAPRRSRSLGDVDDLRVALARFGSSLFNKRRRIVRAIYIANETWKSVWSKFGVVVYMAVIWVLALRDCDNLFVFAKYLTHWGWTVEFAYFAYALFLDISARKAGGAEHVSVIARTVCHALSELAFALQVVVVVFFWAIVYPEQQWRPLSWELHIHGGGLVLIILDYLYRFAGFSIRNHRYIMAFAAFYCALHVGAVFLTGEAIYPGMDFRNLYSFTIFLLGVSTVIYVHKAVYILSHWAYVKQEAQSFYDRSHYILHLHQAGESERRISLPGKLRRQFKSLRSELTTPTRRRWSFDHHTDDSATVDAKQNNILQKSDYKTDPSLTTCRGVSDMPHEAAKVVKESSAK